MNTTDIEVLLDKYKKGETSPEETAIVENWLKNPNSRDANWAKMDSDTQELCLNLYYKRLQIRAIFCKSAINWFVMKPSIDPVIHRKIAGWYERTNEPQAVSKRHFIYGMKRCITLTKHPLKGSEPYKSQKRTLRYLTKHFKGR